MILKTKPFKIFRPKSQVYASNWEPKHRLSKANLQMQMVLLHLETIHNQHHFLDISLQLQEELQLRQAGNLRRQLQVPFSGTWDDWSVLKME